MPTGRMLLAAVVCLLVFGTSPLLYGQATGVISGTVTDATGSAVAGAKVVVTAPAMGVTRDSTTDDSGHYLVPLLPVANYSVRVEFTGFQPAEQKDVRLQVDEHRDARKQGRKVWLVEAERAYEYLRRALQLRPAYAEALD